MWPIVILECLLKMYKMQKKYKWVKRERWREKENERKWEHVEGSEKWGEKALSNSFPSRCCGSRAIWPAKVLPAPICTMKLWGEQSACMPAHIHNTHSIRHCKSLATGAYSVLPNYHDALPKNWRTHKHVQAWIHTHTDTDTLLLDICHVCPLQSIRWGQGGSEAIHSAYYRGSV